MNDIKQLLKIIPQDCQALAEFAEKMAKQNGQKISHYCLERGISPAAINRWRERKNGSYRIDTLIKLMSK